MLFMKLVGDDNACRIVILELAEIESLRKNGWIPTPDKSVVLAYTPDPIWLADKMLDNTTGDMADILKLIEASQARPQKPSERPMHDLMTKKYEHKGK